MEVIVRPTCLLAHQSVHVDGYLRCLHDQIPMEGAKYEGRTKRQS